MTFDAAALEHVVDTLLRRYGVIFWRLLQREAAWLPPWRDLLPVLRRLEARGDLRGGRFVAGVSGEQFALPEAVAQLRDTRRAAGTGELVMVSGADPLNLVGTLLPGARIPALTGNRVLYRDGLAIAAVVGGELRWLTDVTAGGGDGGAGAAGATAARDRPASPTCTNAATRRPTALERSRTPRATAPATRPPTRAGRAACLPA